MPERLAVAALEAADHAGQRIGPSSIRLDHFIILSERAFNALLKAAERLPSNGLEHDRGGAMKTPEQGLRNPAPAAGA
jgi:hypothetical protein